LKKALVVGSRGQDGSYLVEQLSQKGYLVNGVDRGSTDITDHAQVRHLVASVRPDEIYYLAAFHHSSEDLPIDTHELMEKSFAINTLALNHFLDAVADEAPDCRLFYAASSHVFGDPAEDLQDERTAMNPVGAYGISKAAGVRLCRYYRTQRKVFASAGILYNHESPRRSTAFVSRKVVRAAVRISRHEQDQLVIGDLDAKVDWGYAPDYVDAMWRILQLGAPEDFVIASGGVHSVRELVQIAFEAVGLDWALYVQIDPGVTRNSRRGLLQGDSSKIQATTGWHPTKTFREMVIEMVQAEMAQ